MGGVSAAPCILSWPKSLFAYFVENLLKKPTKLFGQPSLRRHCTDLIELRLWIKSDKIRNKSENIYKFDGFRYLFTFISSEAFGNERGDIRFIESHVAFIGLADVTCSFLRR